MQRRIDLFLGQSSHRSQKREQGEEDVHSKGTYHRPRPAALRVGCILLCGFPEQVDVADILEDHPADRRIVALNGRTHDHALAPVGPADQGRPIGEPP